MEHSTNLLRISEVRARTGLSRSHLYQLAQCGEFPSPVKLGTAPSARASAWIESEIADWIAKRGQLRVTHNA